MAHLRCMKTIMDIAYESIRLLSTVHLDEVVEIVAELVERTTGCQSVAVLVWDQDLENFSDTAVFGSRKKEFRKFAEAYAEDFEDDLVRVAEVDVDEVGERLPRELMPVIKYRIASDDHFCACLLVAGPEETDPAELGDKISRFPFLLAIANAWEFRELKRENERLRARYEELEESILSMEEQTRKVIRDLEAKEALHTRKVAYDRLVYLISNAVRSSLKIQEVLQNAVNQIGQSFHVSHCLLVRGAEADDQMIVFEYHRPDQEPARELFISEDGVRFLKAALRREATQHLGPAETDTQNYYDKEFLRRLGLKSGIIVPLILRDKILGVIFLQECASPREFSIDETALLGSLADQLSVAIENAELHEEREKQARTDGLTGVANRRHFTETLYLEFERARRYEQSLSLIVADLDYLKRINDTYGHKTGDDAIRSIARVMSQSSRAIDLCARYGGEEFCLLLPNTDLEMARQIAERLRKLINEAEVEGPGSISASIGVASYPVHAQDPETLFLQADAALYQAKQEGRNRVCVAGAEPATQVQYEI